ncbi:MAG: hydroxymethylglutaryl-CoA lyase [Gammaproteobacteria bacterium]|nr:hydroxymethylglutaryl-CoA lyase [Gammaproteobacteria bacterium]
MTDQVSIVEVGPRDGLQNEPQPLSVPLRIELIRRLAAAGLNRIEVGAMVSPKHVPAMAGSSEVLQAIAEREFYTSVLVPNVRGLQSLPHPKASDEIAVFTAASDAFNLKNIGCDIAESLARIKAVIAEAEVPVRGYVSCIFACPYSGEVDMAKVTEVSQVLLEMGCYEVSLGDTTGVGTYREARRRFRHWASTLGAGKLAGHFHDTYGQGLANVCAALEEGVRRFDSSVAGLGGCPYAPGASGNLATENLLYLLSQEGMHTEANLEAVIDTAHWINHQLNRSAQSALMQTERSTCQNPSS